MERDDIRIEQVRISELEEFARSAIARAKDGQLLPITRQRAVAHAHNPYADPDDVGLLVAYQDEACVGYFGIMPVLLRSQGKLHKVHWFSTWYVSPRLRGKALGSRLMQAALELNQDYLIVGSGPARKVCRRFGFLERVGLHYFVLDPSAMQRLNLVRLVNRFWRKVLHLLGVKVSINNRFAHAFEALVAPLTRPIIYRWLWRSVRDDYLAVQTKQVRTLSGKLAGLARRTPEVGLVRGVEAINWMLVYPWVVEPDESPTGDLDFYFSDVRPVFKNIAVEIYGLQDRRLLGFAVFSLSTIDRKLTLKILDHGCVDPADRKYVLALAVHYAREQRADRLELPGHLVDYFGGRLLRSLLLVRKSRTYQAHPKGEDSPLAQAWPEFSFAYPDGDMPFS